MRIIWKIAKIELQMLFYSPVAWLVILIFVFQTGWFFSDRIFEYAREQEMGELTGWSLSYVGHNVFNMLLYNTLQYLYLYIPLLTMGLMSRDLAGGTIKLLHSSPLSNREIILGKFLSMVVFALVLVGIVFVYVVIGMILIENLDVMWLLTALLGLFLLICAYASIGLFMSTISRYQIVAAMGTFIVLAFLNYVNMLWQGIEFVRDITFWLSISGRAEQFISGMICSEDVIYFIIVPAMFICFSIIILDSRVRRTTWTRNMLKYVAVFLVVSFIGYLSSRPHLMGYLDMTWDKSNTLTKNSQDVIKKLKGGLTITTYSNLLTDDWFEAVPERVNFDRYHFEQYIRFKPDIEMKYVYYYDSVKSMRMMAFPDTTLSLEQKARRIAHLYETKFSRYLSPEEIRKIIDLRPEKNLFVRLVERESGEKMFLRKYNDMQGHPGEAEITAAFKRMVMTLPTVGFLTGHGERDIYRDGDRDYARFATDKWFRYALVNQGFETQEVTLTREIPDSISILVIADMKRPLSPEESENLDRYVARGGNLVIVGEHSRQEYMNPLIEPFGVRFMDNVLVAPSEDMAPDVINIHPTPEAVKLAYQFGILEKRKFLKATMSGAIGLSYVTDKGFNVYPLLKTDSTGVWNELETKNFIDDTVCYNPTIGEKEEIYTTGLALSRMIGDKEQKIVILGDADCLSNGELFKVRNEDHEPGNYYIILGTFYWLSDGEAPIDIRRPGSRDNKLFISKDGAAILKVAFNWIIPVLILIGGLFVWLRRRGR